MSFGFNRFLAVGFLLVGIGVEAQEAVPAMPASASVRIIPGRALKSPVENFRKLLAMDADELAKTLSIYPPAAREKLKAKLLEYQLLPEPLRELRLQSTELRWYLLPLLKMPVDVRTERVKMIPEPYQKLISTRLEEWDIWPPSLRQEVLEYESTMHYLVGRNAEVQPQMGLETLSAAERTNLERKAERWKELPLPQRQQMYGAFQHYFELSETEKQKTLDTLPVAEREETEKVLDEFEKWPKEKQADYMVAFRRFSEMSDEERQQFMKNAQRWQKMSETERQAWRDLVKQLSEMPPMPNGFVPPAKSVAAGSSISGKTNPTAAPLK